MLEFGGAETEVHPWFKDADYHCQLLKAYLEHCPVVATIDPYDQANSSELLLRCALGMTSFDTSAEAR
eukprot:4009543-Amphidinium_carterae.1